MSSSTVGRERRTSRVKGILSQLGAELVKGGAEPCHIERADSPKEPIRHGVDPRLTLRQWRSWGTGQIGREPGSQAVALPEIVAPAKELEVRQLMSSTLCHWYDMVDVQVVVRAARDASALVSKPDLADDLLG